MLKKKYQRLTLKDNIQESIIVETSDVIEEIKKAREKEKAKEFLTYTNINERIIDRYGLEIELMTVDRIPIEQLELIDKECEKLFEKVEEIVK